MALLASTLPAGTKYATPQELLNLFAQNLSIPASDSTLFVLSNTTPTDVSKVWIDTSGASPVLKIYINGAWTSISVAANFPNGLTVTGADINLINNTVFVSNTNNRVGIGTASPTQKLDVAGAVRCQSLTLTSGGTLAADNITVGGAISATGSTGSISASNLSTTNLTVNGTLNIPGTSISTGLIQDSAITTAKILDANVTEIKLSSPIRADLKKAAAVRAGSTIPTTGRVKGIAILDGGSGYSGCSVAVAPPSEAGGVTATAVATIVAGVITQITVTDEGSGYTELNPAVTLTGDGINASAVAYACVKPLPVEEFGKSCTAGNSSLVITTHNTIKVAGDNSQGQLGVGSTVAQSDARDVFLWDSFYVSNNLPQPYPVQIYSSGYSNYVLASDGSLWSTGANGAGQLGKGYTGASDNNNIFTRITFSGGGVVKKFAVSWDASGTERTTCLALLESSSGMTLYGWGYNGYSQLGNGGTANVNTPTPITTVVSGADNYNTIQDFVIAGASIYTSCVVLFSSGKVRTCGYNAGAQLSRGSVNAVTAFGYAQLNASTDLTDVVEIAAGGGYTGQVFFRTSSGRIYASGYNGQGQLGVGDTTTTTTYVRENALGAIWPTGPGKNIFTSGSGNGSGIVVNVAWAVAANGSIYRWGYNGYGNLVNGLTTNITTPAILSGYNISSIKAIRPFATHGNTGGVLIWLNDGRIFVGGYNGLRNLGIGNVTSPVTSLNLLRFPQDRVKDVCWLSKYNDDHALAILTTDGNLYTTAGNTSGRHFRGTLDAAVSIPTSARL